MSDKRYYAPYLTRRQAISDTLSDTFGNSGRFQAVDVTIYNDRNSRNGNGLRRIASRFYLVEAAGTLERQPSTLLTARSISLSASNLRHSNFHSFSWLIFDLWDRFQWV